MSVLVGILAAVLLAVGVVFLIFKALQPTATEKEKEAAMAKEKSKEEKPKPTGFWWKTWIVLRHPITLIVPGSIIVLNWLVWAISHDFWESFWGNPSRFWATNICFWGAIALVLIKTDDEKKARILRWLSVGIGGLVALILILSVYDYKKESFASTPTSTAMRPTSLSGVPWAVARLYISGCESGIDGKPGTGRQLDSDGNLIRNPDHPDVVGKYQINLADRAVATAVLTNGWDVYTEEGNEKAAEYLYSQDQFGPWEDTQSCWGPKLLAFGYGIEITTTATYVAPVGKFSDEVLIPAGIFFSWGDSEGSFVIRDQKGAEARYDPNNSIVENLPYPNKKIAFKSLEEKPATVRLKFSKVPFR